MKTGIGLIINGKSINKNNKYGGDFEGANEREV